MKWHFRTIGMGSINYRLASRRLAIEATSTGLFQTSQGLTESEFAKLSPIFWQQHRNVLKPRVPGFGWWVWKPYFILETLLALPEGDGLLYLDAGSVIKQDAKSIAEIQKHMALTVLQGVTGSNSDSYEEQMYSSNDILNHFSLSNSQRLDSQYYGGLLYVINTQEGRHFVREWCRLVCEEEHRWLLPKEFVVPNHVDFHHHMHDQAILSCMMKAGSKIPVEVGNEGVEGPIRLARHRYGYSFFERRVLVRLPFEVINLLQRYFLALQRRILRKSMTRRPKSHILNIP